MAIEIAFLSVVLRKSSLERLAPRSQDLARALFRWEPDWYREDDHLMGTTFMAPADVRNFGRVLEQRLGLIRVKDWLVVDMAVGPTESAHWLESRCGINQLSGAWLQGSEPGELVRVPTLLPGDFKVPPEIRGVAKLFGQDSHHDDIGHRADFGRFIPAWGGRDRWAIEISGGVHADGHECRAGVLSMEATRINFDTLCPAP